MQVRLGNKQDEQAVRELVATAMTEVGGSVDLSGKDADLKNIDHEYIWHDGIFLVAEADSKIIAFAAARRLTEETLQIRRFLIDKQWHGNKLASQMLDALIKFALDMDYRYLDAIVDPHLPGVEKILLQHDFSSPVEDGICRLVLADKHKLLT